jgi:hypothetical protein
MEGFIPLVASTKRIRGAEADFGRRRLSGGSSLLSPFDLSLVPAISLVPATFGTGQKSPMCTRQRFGMKCDKGISPVIGARAIRHRTRDALIRPQDVVDDMGVVRLLGKQQPDK